MVLEYDNGSLGVVKNVCQTVETQPKYSELKLMGVKLTTLDGGSVR